MLWSNKSTFDGWTYKLLCFSMQQVGHKCPSLICKSSLALWDAVQCRTVALEKAACLVCHPSIRDDFVLESTVFEIEVFFTMFIAYAC